MQVSGERDEGPGWQRGPEDASDRRRAHTTERPTGTGRVSQWRLTTNKKKKREDRSRANTSLNAQYERKQGQAPGPKPVAKMTHKTAPQKKRMRDKQNGPHGEKSRTKKMNLRGVTKRLRPGHDAQVRVGENLTQNTRGKKGGHGDRSFS